MANQASAPLTEYIERAKKILQFEQRTNHQDQAIKPGGLEVFAARWAEETSNACRSTGHDPAPVHHIMEYLAGYRLQDPMQRAVSIRSALSLLNEMGGGNGAKLSTRLLAEQPSAPAEKSIHSQPATKEHAPTVERVKSSMPSVVAPITPPARLAQKPIIQTQSTSRSIRLEAGMTQGHTVLTLLTADVTAVPGVGPSVAARMYTLGIHTVRDLLFYFPREHRDYSKLEKITNIPFGELTTTMGMIWEVESKRLNGGRQVIIATISDDTGKLRVSWFNQGYLQKQLLAAKGSFLVVTGIKQRFGNKIEFSVRSHELPDQGDLLNTGRLVPTYPLTEGLSGKALRRFTKWVVDRYAPMVPDHLPAAIRVAGELLPLPDAISHIHYPESEEMLTASRRRLAFDELFLIQLGMQERRSRWKEQVVHGNAFTVDLGKIFVHPPASAEAPQNVVDARPLGTTLWSTVTTEEPFEATLPFTFTDAQRRVLQQICADLARTQPMCRLLQGDVGAGKTAVAAAALYMAAINGYQGAIMAPTELLAEQHSRSITAMLEPFGIRTVLLTGSLKQRERTAHRTALENGAAMVAIGTQALIQDDVEFSKLGLVIIDEQHRFGVEQRDALRKKGYHPHMLVMTATPIPRTLALTLYGDLDISIIDQLPPGRQKIITRWRTGARRPEANTTIVHQVEEGRQAFIICPLVEESETLAVKAATSEYKRLKLEVFPYKRLGLVHGAMKAAEKDAVMRQFRDHELDILVATSVIEVGIDIPNATVMVIEDADRFGLSQLHQFRGRVGRGKHQSYCYVLSEDASLGAQERLGVFEDTDDGFKLSEEDLRLRGPGDFFGVRQSGMPELKMANLSDTPLVELTGSLAEKLWESDPYLRKPEHAPLRERMHLFWQSFVGH